MSSHPVTAISESEPHRRKAFSHRVASPSSRRSMLWFYTAPFALSQAERERCTLAPTRGGAGGANLTSSNTHCLQHLSVIDVVMFNGELSMLRYRFQLHAAFAEAFVVAESALTWSGLAKPLYANASLTNAERSR